MEDKRDFSLSYYFEELQKKETKVVKRGVSEETFSTTAQLLALKALKGSEEQKLTLTALSKAVNLKIASCQELVEHLGDEGLVEVEADNEIGNDLVKLTQKGNELL
jgi:predicted transcriptional regulator